VEEGFPYSYHTWEKEKRGLSDNIKTELDSRNNGKRSPRSKSWDSEYAKNVKDEEREDWKNFHQWSTHITHK